MRKLVLGIALALAASVAYAQGLDSKPTAGPYFGASLSEARIDGWGNQFDLNTGFDLNDRSWKLMGGWRFNDHFSLEANYMDLGSDEAIGEATRYDLDSRAISAYATGMLPLRYVDLFAKAGFAWWDDNVSADFDVPDGVERQLFDSDTKLGWGAGIQARFNNVGARLEYEYIDIARADGLELYSLGLTYTFDVLR